MLFVFACVLHCQALRDIVHRDEASFCAPTMAAHTELLPGKRSTTELHSKSSSNDSDSSTQGDRVRKRDRVKRFLIKAVPNFFKRLRNGGIDGTGDANIAGGLHDDKSIVSGDAVFGASKTSTSDGTETTPPRYRRHIFMHFWL
jgi:hypothetical protein